MRNTKLYIDKKSGYQLLYVAPFLRSLKHEGLMFFKLAVLARTTQTIMIKIMTRKLISLIDLCIEY
jgi:hypothetical protein